MTARRSRPGCVHVGLLRGINVGGKNRLPMQALAEIFAQAGGTEVRTYIQSGNVLFTATCADAGRIQKSVPRAIAERFGFLAPVVIRTADELAQVVSRNPFIRRGVNAEAIHVAFLADLPDRRRVAALDVQRSPGDAFEVHGRDVYLHLSNGVARSRLTNAYFDSVLGTTSTLRNWRTVLKLVELTTPAR